VEAKILDSQGQLDVPAQLPGVDRVLIADHQFPGEAGPVHPREVRAQLAAGQRTPEEVIDGLISATVRALGQVAAAQLAHLFSLLPKMGLAESDVPGPALAKLAQAARRAGARLEVNEKWACPSARVIRVFATAGVPLVPAGIGGTGTLLPPDGVTRGPRRGVVIVRIGAPVNVAEMAERLVSAEGDAVADATDEARARVVELMSAANHRH